MSLREKLLESVQINLAFLQSTLDGSAKSYVDSIQNAGFKISDQAIRIIKTTNLDKPIKKTKEGKTNQVKKSIRFSCGIRWSESFCVHCGGLDFTFLLSVFFDGLGKPSVGSEID